jgi:H+/Cl- antiporter ClcA
VGTSTVTVAPLPIPSLRPSAWPARIPSGGTARAGVTDHDRQLGGRLDRSDAGRVFDLLQLLGVWGASAGVSNLLGPLLGGLLTVALGWRADWWALVPLALLAASAIVVHVPRVLHDQPAESRGAAVNTVVLAAAFVAALTFAVMIGSFYIAEQYLQRAAGYSALAASSVLVLAALLVGAAAPIAGRLADRRGERLPATAGFLATGAGLLVLGLPDVSLHSVGTIAALIPVGFDVSFGHEDQSGLEKEGRNGAATAAQARHADGRLSESAPSESAAAVPGTCRRLSGAARSVELARRSTAWTRSDGAGRRRGRGVGRGGVPLADLCVHVACHWPSAVRAAGPRGKSARAMARCLVPAGGSSGGRFALRAADQGFAREARGHGVPEVMLAVAENGGRIRPPVTIVKALASAMCIGTGGSVGREGPIVQIGSALASTLGQLVRMFESRLRIIVACGAAGGIAATFNAPLTGLFFGFEIVLREFSLDALFATGLAAVTGDVISRVFFAPAPFFNQIPHGLGVVNDTSYLLVAVLAIAAGLIGIGFKTSLYRFEDLVDDLWKGRPEWARPALGGVALGVVLLVLPQMYGVGYPVMDKVIAGHVVVWLIVVCMLGRSWPPASPCQSEAREGVRPLAVHRRDAGMAFGTVAHHLFGSAIGPPAMHAVVAMGGVFAAAAQAPLTAIVSVAEMTGNFGLTLPIIFGCGIASALSKHLSYGSIYTTKLLRRGIDIERPKTTNVLQALTVADVMQPLPQLNGRGSASPT